MPDYDYPGPNPLYGVTLNDGDVMRISPGGGPASVTVNHGALVSVQGGSILGVTINDGGRLMQDSGITSGVTLHTGGTADIEGGRVDGAAVQGGSLTVGAGATSQSAYVTNGGVYHLSGSSISESVRDGGRIILDQPGYHGSVLTDPSAPQAYILSMVVGTGGVLEIQNGDTTGVELRGGTIAVDPVRFDATVAGSYDSQTQTLSIHGASGSYDLHIADAPGNGADDFMLSADSSGAVDVTLRAEPLCFLAGTRIATPDGEMAVEAIRPGQRVLTHDGVVRRVAWVGGGEGVSDGTNGAVIICAGALADGVPHADLAVTAGHSLLVDGVLIPAGELVNGSTIRRAEAGRPFRYVHVELDAHAVLVANGAPAESYRDDGNRGGFAWSEGVPAGPLGPCAPVLTEGAIVDAAWARLAARAPAAPPLTGDPDLHLLVDGRRVEATRAGADLYLFDLPAAGGAMTLASRHAVPAEVGLGRDQRRLGVAVRRCWIETNTGGAELDLAAVTRDAGFHDAEADAGFRWTTGAAVLRARLPAGAQRARLGVEVACRARYRVEPA